MKTSIVLVLSIMLFVVWIVLFLIEDVSRKYSQVIGRYKVSADFYGPRYSWFFNKKSLFKGDGGNAQFALKHSFGESIHVDNVKIDKIAVFYENELIGVSQEEPIKSLNSLGIISNTSFPGLMLPDEETPDVSWGIVKEYNSQTRDGRYIWYDNSIDRTVVANRVDNVWTTLYDVAGNKLADPEAIEVLFTGKTSTLETVKVYKIASDVIDAVVLNEPWTSGIFTKSEVPK